MRTIYIQRDGSSVRWGMNENGIHRLFFVEVSHAVIYNLSSGIYKVYLYNKRKRHVEFDLVLQRYDKEIAFSHYYSKSWSTYMTFCNDMLGKIFIFIPRKIYVKFEKII